MPTKSDLIRDYLAKFPDMGPSEMAKTMLEENKGLTLRAQEISTLKSRIKGSGKAGNGRRTPKKASPPSENGPAPQPKRSSSVADQVAKLKEAADALGKEEAKRIIDLLA